MVGADLEDGNRNTLSQLCNYEADTISSENMDAKYDKNGYFISRYEDELKAAGLELPAYFYEPIPYIKNTPDSGNTDVEDVFYGGAASKDISEMTSGVWSDNIKIVIQTGGSKYWVNQRVNPNRTQRFEYYKGELNEVENLPMKDCGSAESLTDFLRFCKDNYESDHRMLVLWNHGGGPFGYGYESIFNNNLSIRDVRSALRNVYLPNINDPAFDIIGFDACLMSNIDVTHALHGFADYYCLSEEVEPGDGWDYGPFLEAMTSDPTMHPAQVASMIANTYMDFYMVQNQYLEGYRNDVTFSVIDAKKAEELYKAYCELAKIQLIDSMNDPGILADIGRCADKATCYAMDAYNIFNLCDLGNYVDYMIDNYPDECSKIKDLIREAVLYHRENGSMSDSEGISAYIPHEVTSLNGLIRYLQYEYEICDDRSIAALYYYKQAGCMSDEQKRYLKSLTDEEPEVLDLDAFKEFGKTEPEYDEYGFLIPISDKLQSVLVDYEMELEAYDKDENCLVDFGSDYSVYLDGEGNIASNFDGGWIHMDGMPLHLEPIGCGTEYAQYRAHITYNSDEAYLILVRDLNTDEVFVIGFKKVGSSFSSDANTRSMDELENGARIAPIYEIFDLDTKEDFYAVNDEITYSEKTDFEYITLDNGDYLTATKIEDQRGDHYYSQVMGVSVKNGSTTDWHTENEFYASNY